MKQRHFCVVSHTHWDREWYEVFQEYRMRLVRMIDNLLDILDEREDYAYFHLDGQTIVLEDYLEIRPHQRERLLGHIRSGRILVGPWYVMPDEFLVSGESLIKNLNIGMNLCQSIGAEPMPCGYIPDLFGHNNQFPQLLRGFDLDSTLLFRGVADYSKDAFRWKALDGSTVTALRVDRERAYSNFYFAIRYPFEGREYNEDEMVANMRALLARMDPEATSDVYLMMDGVDHMDAEDRLPEILATLQKHFPEDTFEHTTLTDYLERVRAAHPDLETIEGSLYRIGTKGINNWLLKNVLSSMVHNKQHNDACERALSGLAGPMQAFLSIEGAKAGTVNDVRDREDFLRVAWKTLVQNHPHDSICGCSISDVHEDMEYRFRQTAAISRSLVKNMGEQLSACIDTSVFEGCGGAAVVYNPTQEQKTGVQQVTVLLPGVDLKRVELVDETGKRLDAQLLHTEPVMEHRYPVKTLIQFEPKTAATYAMPLDIAPNGYRTIGWRLLKTAFPGPGEYTAEWENPHRLSGSMRVAPMRFDNGRLLVEFACNGTMAVTEKATGKRYEGLLRLEDGGDMGEGYNYAKPQPDRVFYSTSADVAVVCDGPLAAVVRIAVNMNLPAHREHPEQSECVAQQVVHTVTILKDCAQISVRTALDNKTKNHRMRMLFPTMLRADEFYTKTPFAMTRWDVQSHDWQNAREEETFVHPSQGVTLIRDGEGALAVSTRGLYEVEVTDDPSRTLAVTLFRSFPNEAGGLRSEMGGMLRRLEFDLMLHFDAALTPADALIAGESWRQGGLSFPASVHAGALPAARSFLRWNGGKLVQSAFERQPVVCGGERKTACVLRAYDVSGQASDSRVTFARPIRAAHYVNLKGDCSDPCPFEGNTLTLHAEPYQIVSVALQFEEPAE